MQQKTRNLVAYSRLALAVLLALPALATAQGTIHGIVLNGVNGQPVHGATLTAEGTEAATRSDLDGLFTGELPAGTHVVVAAKNGFEAQKIGDVVVTDGKVTEFSVVMMPAGGGSDADVDTSFAEAITVITEADRTTESAVLLERKQAAQISDLIGKEEFSKNPGGDAAGVLSRVTGVSVQEGKYVYVRGLGGRYSNTTLNGSKLPSTEYEKKVVPLDLFPSDLLDKVSVSKSYSVTQPGEFAAGSIDMQTRQFPASQTLSVGISMSQNSISTGEAFSTSAGGLGFFGSGGQGLPGGIPAQPLIPLSPITGDGFTQEELEGFAQDLVGVWTPSGTFNNSGPFGEGDPGYGFDLGYGNTFGKFGVVLSGTYGSDQSVRNEQRNFYNLSGTTLVPNEDYTLDYSTESVNTGGMANLSYAASGNTRLELRSIFTNITNSEGRYQDGFFSDLDDEIRDYRISHTDQQILNFQLRGEHFLSNAFKDGSLLEWRVAQSEASTDENRRQTLYLQGSSGDYFLTDNAQSGFMYFNDLDDEIFDAALDWSSFFSGKRTGSVQAGLSMTQNDREFLGRRLRYTHQDTFGLDLTLPAEELFVSENFPDAFAVEEITRSTDTYLGDHEVMAAYLQADMAIKKWRFILGARWEDSTLQVDTFDRNATNPIPLTTVLDETELPFSLSAVYQLTDSMNLRTVASHTLNRPNFRELAPFTFTHIVGGYAIQGNPDLVSATIDSFDLRWEWFPGPTEVIAASLFYKDFDKPIEQVVIPGAEFLETFANADSAENFGVELELRRNLGALFERFEPLSVMLNYTWVDSEITINPDLTAESNVNRPLVGQPDSVLNFVLEWDRPKSNSLVRALYNMTGDRVATAGAFGLPDTIEEARSTIDLIYIQGLSRGIKAKLSARNLTDETWEWTQGGLPFRSFDRGREVSLSFSYSQ